MLMGRGKSADAESLYSRALSILDQPGNANPELLNQVLTEYATVLHDLKRPADALKPGDAAQGRQAGSARQADNRGREGVQVSVDCRRESKAREPERACGILRWRRARRFAGGLIPLGEELLYAVHRKPHVRDVTSPRRNPPALALKDV